MRMLDRLFGRRHESRGDVAFREAMRESSDLITRMRDNSNCNDAARAIMADVWSQHHNVPFLTTVYEAVQEAKSGPDQEPS